MKGLVILDWIRFGAYECFDVFILLIGGEGSLFCNVLKIRKKYFNSKEVKYIFDHHVPASYIVIFCRNANFNKFCIVTTIRLTLSDIGLLITHYLYFE